MVSLTELLSLVSLFSCSLSLPSLRYVREHKGKRIKDVMGLVIPQNSTKEEMGI